MRLRHSILMLALAAAALSLQAQEVCPCVPISHQWIVTACQTWNCAVAATVMSNGSSDVLALPSGSDDFKWVVLRRVVTGSATIPTDAPFKLETFSTLAEAMTRFAAVDESLKPMLLTAPDGNVVVVMRTVPLPRHPAVGH